MTKSYKGDKIHKKALSILTQNKIPFLVGGTFALRIYTEIKRETNDLDLFCKAGDVLQIIDIFKKEGLKVEMPDARWLAKVLDEPHHHLIDLIFSTPQGIITVDDSWFENPHSAQILGFKVKLVPPEEMIWSKTYRQDRFHFEGADVAHMILKLGPKLDWRKILSRMEPHWELLFATILNFRFIYPSERGNVPKWLMEELTKRLALQLTSPIPEEKITRGPLLAIDPYKVDTEKWGFKTIT